MNAKHQLPSMYETNQAVAGLNKVPGFDPRICLRRTKSKSGNHEVLKLDLRYKKLWFRLAYPTGRLKTTALRITEQLAIIEAKVFLDRSDTEPVANFTVQRTVHDTPGGLYIQAAQYEAQDAALNDAGFGLQFSDVSVAPGEEIYGSELPLNTFMEKSVATEQSDSIPIDTENAISSPTTVTSTANVAVNDVFMADIPAESLNELPASEPSTAENIAIVDAVTDNTAVTAIDTESVPEAQQTVDASLPEESLQVTELNSTAEIHPMEEIPSTEIASSNETQPTMEAQSPDNSDAGTSPISFAEHMTQETPTDNAPRYTNATPVAELLTLMTYEEACNVYVDIGTCNGLTMKTVAERRPPSLKWYIHGYNGDNNILRAAAQIMLDSLSVPKAG